MKQNRTVVVVGATTYEQTVLRRVDNSVAEFLWFDASSGHLYNRESTVVRVCL